MLKNGIAVALPCHLLLLVHEHMVRHIIDNAFAKHGHGQVFVRLFRRHFLQLARIQHKIVALGPEQIGHLPAKHEKRESIAVLLFGIMVTIRVIVL